MFRMNRLSQVLVLAGMLTGMVRAADTIALAGDYANHLQDVWKEGPVLWWAHTDVLVKTDLEGRILASSQVGGHHAGLEIKDGRLYTAVCAYNGEPRGETTPACHVMIGEYDADTLVQIRMHVLDINDRAGSFCFLADGSCLVGCLRHPALGPSEIKFHHLDREFHLIQTHVIDVGQDVSLGIEVIKRVGNDVLLFPYGTLAVHLNGTTLQVTGLLQMPGGDRGFVLDGTSVWIGKSTARASDARWESQLVRKSFSPVAVSNTAQNVTEPESERTANWFNAHVPQCAAWPMDAARAEGGRWGANRESAARVLSPGALTVSTQEPLKFAADRPKTLGGNAVRTVVESDLVFEDGPLDELPMVDPAWKCGVTLVREVDGVHYYGLARVGAANDWVRLDGPLPEEGGRAVRLRVTFRTVHGARVANYEIGGTRCTWNGTSDIEVVSDACVRGVAVQGDGTLYSLLGDGFGNGGTTFRIR